MNIPLENKPAAVSDATKQVGEVRAAWPFAESSVWTPRMLTALENGVRGGKWFSLIDKVYKPENLRVAFEKVKANAGGAGVDHVDVERFEKRLDRNLDHLHDSLKDDSYRPQAVKRVWIPKPGGEKRPLGVPTVRDRVVQTALRNVLEPIFEREFNEHSYGFRPGRSAKDALRRVDEQLKSGHDWIVDADIRSYFDEIDHGILMNLVEDRVSDGRVLRLVRRFLDQEIQEGGERTKPESGTPQGAVISPMMANIFLNPLDHLMSGRGFKMTRYADDFVIACKSESEARGALEAVREWCKNAKLELHPEKTRIVNMQEPGGCDFLGYHFEWGYKNRKRQGKKFLKRTPAKKSMRKLKDAIRVKTRRANGYSLRTIIKEVNKTLVGWFEYFKHSHQYTFDPLDRWIRMRLRSILRKRNGGRGRSRGMDHRKWSNAFFVDSGLFSLRAAYESTSQSSRR
jgi:RNA-directed DNA polymerase